jgi:hypothetical protein
VRPAAMTCYETKNLLSDLLKDLFDIDIEAWPSGWNTTLEELELTPERLDRLALAIKEQENQEIVFEVDSEIALDLVEDLLDQIEE